ncbi:MAG TPA: energy transducer TonB [Gallionellaceae bacterium]|nr:energy transducer TonB [Gallionellaceae bacterium]
MLIDAPAWFSGEHVDSPWQRLYWTLPLALLICASGLFLFSDFMEHDAPTAPKPLPVDAQIIELPSPAAAHAPAHREPAPPPPPPPPAAKQPALPQPAPPPRQANAAPAPAAPARPAPAQPAAPATPNRGAQSVAHPMPVIPDDLREDAMNAVATARFHVASDGSVVVELIQPTQNPRLNRFLLEALRRWKFSPAIQDGKPVPSVEDIVVRVNVE